MAPSSARASNPEHRPVLLEEALHYLAPRRGGCFVDCTVGLGGHSAAILERFEDATVFAVDRDFQALEIARRRLEEFGSRVRWAAGRFSQLRELLDEQGIHKVSGVLADLGVSSMQLDLPERGFSFRSTGPLDMRMGETGRTAADIVNHEPEEALASIFREYGEERHGRRIARKIVERRREEPFETTADLCRVVERATPPRRGAPRRIHPATRTFQALRIEVNRELEELDALLDQAGHLLEGDGRLVVISYQSLEDRAVKNTLRDLALGEVDQVTGRPRSETQVIEVLTRKPVRPEQEEVAANPRARSARLRAARRL